MEPKDVLQPVDAEARRLAKTLLRRERHGALATIDPGTGAPAPSRVNHATTMRGDPVFLISRLSAHFGALEAEPRAGLMLGTPGGGDPLAHPRLSLQGVATMLSGDARVAARRRFLARHRASRLYADFTDFAFWSLRVERASLVGGFGRAYSLTPNDLATAVPSGFEEMEEGAVEHMNEDHTDAIALYAERLLDCAPGEWRLAGLDPEGLDLVHGDAVARLWFETPLSSPAELRPCLVSLAKAARENADDR
ncbi:MAG: DUF2470 domain-containing protein [Pseudomonadota bacterium]